ncbi:MAG: tetratricopeptide repeat protein, partial [Planctomycetota bacterium]
MNRLANSWARRGVRRLLTSAVVCGACLCIAGPTLAQADKELPPVTVLTKDARTFEGELVRQTPSSIVLRIAGIETPFAIEDVETFTIGKTVSEEYRDRRAALDQDDPEAWYQIAYFLFDRGRLEQAAAETNALLARHPDDTPGRRLKALIESRQLLEDQRTVQPEPAA